MSVLSRATIAAARALAKRSQHRAFQELTVTSTFNGLGYDKLWTLVGSSFTGRLCALDDDEVVRYGGNDPRKLMKLVQVGLGPVLATQTRVKDTRSNHRYVVVAVAFDPEADVINAAYVVAEDVDG